MLTYLKLGVDCSKLPISIKKNKREEEQLVSKKVCCFCQFVGIKFEILF